uniref:Uncharacterized protein AlNc14C12G1455 n=1 Tax=Albugo laibachii Nc14 TaxID=890382 RepID=F0W377_9STRA|nr:conserved hypothetical protein [Albugo laibachii Nc14]|eukprot:CCA15518.1 conserved hypothetical protein [Albugo laibachii Nc14]
MTPLEVTEEKNELVVDVQNVISRIPDEIISFRNELDKLLTRYTRSQESEQGLLRRDAEIKKEIEVIHEFRTREQEDENDAMAQKVKCRVELDVIYSQLEISTRAECEKEKALKDEKHELGILQDELLVLNQQDTVQIPPSDDANSLKSDVMSRILKFRVVKSEIAQEIETKTVRLQELKKDTANLTILLEEAEARHEHLIELRDRKQDLIAEKKRDTESGTRRKTRLERELRKLKLYFGTLSEEMRTKETQLKDIENQLTNDDSHARGSKDQLDRYIKQIDTIYRTTHTYTETTQVQWQKNIQLQHENQQIEHDIVQERDKTESICKDSIKIEKLIQIAKEQLHEVGRKNAECQREQETSQAELANVLNISVENEQNKRNLLEKKAQYIQREQESLNRVLLRAHDRSQLVFDLFKVKENTQKNLQNELQGITNLVKQQRQQIKSFIDKRGKYELDAKQASNKHQSLLKEAKIQDTQVAALQQKISESDKRLKKQQNLYETLRADRNVYSKQLIEAQQSINDLKRQFKIMNDHIERLKEEISFKDHALVKEHFDHHKVDKDKEVLRNEVTRLNKQIASSEQIMENQEVEMRKLSKIIHTADLEKQRQSNEYRQVIQERDKSRQQMLQCQNELRVLHEKIQIQKGTLLQGAKQLQERSKEIEQLQTRIREMQLAQSLDQEKATEKTDLSKEAQQLEKDLSHERIKIQALASELSHPLNIHRWRRLEESDPPRFAMVKNMHIVQRQLVQKFDEIAAKDLMILEKEKLYVELKMVLSRQVGTQVLDQLAAYKETLKAKRNHMKQMEEELGLYKMQVKEYKEERENYRKEKQKILQDWMQRQLGDVPFSGQITRLPDKSSSQLIDTDDKWYGNSNPEDAV